MVSIPWVYRAPSQLSTSTAKNSQALTSLWDPRITWCCLSKLRCTLQLQKKHVLFWSIESISGWWFGTCFYFPSYMGCHPSHWRTHIFQDGYCTTNQILYGNLQSCATSGYAQSAVISLRVPPPASQPCWHVSWRPPVPKVWEFHRRMMEKCWKNGVKMMENDGKWVIDHVFLYLLILL